MIGYNISLKCDCCSDDIRTDVVYKIRRSGKPDSKIYHPDCAKTLTDNMIDKLPLNIIVAKHINIKYPVADMVDNLTLHLSKPITLQHIISEYDDYTHFLVNIIRVCDSRYSYGSRDKLDKYVQNNPNIQIEFNFNDAYKVTVIIAKTAKRVTLTYIGSIVSKYKIPRTKSYRNINNALLDMCKLIKADFYNYNTYTPDAEQIKGEVKHIIDTALDNSAKSDIVPINVRAINKEPISSPTTIDGASVDGPIDMRRAKVTPNAFSEMFYTSADGNLLSTKP